jgi:hypothetical protein
MKRNHIRIFLVIALFTSILVWPAYLSCSRIVGARHLSADVCLENPDQENVFSDQQNQSKGFISSVFSTKLLPGTDLCNQISRFSFTSPSPDEKTLILRC